jgi:hypothetical protein
MSACIGPLASEPSYLHLRPSAPMKVVQIQWMKRQLHLSSTFVESLYEHSTFYISSLILVEICYKDCYV